MRMYVTITFDRPGDFMAMAEAEHFLAERGFSVGGQQHGAPRGILFGSVDIQKWRNLAAADRTALHGLMTGDMRTGPVAVTLFPRAPHAALQALEGREAA